MAPPPEHIAAGATDAASQPPPGPRGADAWSQREFLIKWKHHSYLACSWERQAALAPLPGSKRVLNYIKRVDEREAVLPHLSREERELIDVELQMEEQLVEQYKQVGAFVVGRGCGAAGCVGAGG